jgi:hypothetical protein
MDLTGSLMRRCLIVLLAMGTGSALRPGSAGAQGFSPYSDFKAMSQTQFATLQVKLTYAGNQTVGARSVLFTALGNQPDITLFTPFRRAGVSYVNDNALPQTFTATTQELKAMIDGVGTLPDVTDGDVDPDGYISFALLNTAGGATKAFEAVVNDTTAPPMFGRLLAALQGNAAGVRMISQFGCGADALPTDMPASLEGLVNVSFSGLSQDHHSKNVLVGKVRVTNTSASTIVAPISLVVVRHGNAELLGETGLTCNIHPQGFPYVDLPVGTGLAPGTSVVATLRFSNPTGNKFDLKFRAFSGPGIR